MGYINYALVLMLAFACRLRTIEATTLSTRALLPMRKSVFVYHGRADSKVFHDRQFAVLVLRFLKANFRLNFSLVPNVSHCQATLKKVWGFPGVASTQCLFLV